MRVLSLTVLATLACTASSFFVAVAPVARTRGDVSMIFKLPNISLGGASPAPAPAKKPAAPAPAKKAAAPAPAPVPKVTVGADEYVPDGLTRAQWAEFKAKEAAKKAQRKPKPAKVETLEEWQDEFEKGKTQHRFAKMKFDGWYSK